ncbi:MAG: hypothetical protein U9P72_11920 [Campylobacterota bacterium]|nr:hypothetical protein [Campylobacterota bacterium]
MLTNEQLDYIMDVVNSNDNLIEHDYKGKENQVLISKELADKIITFTKSIKDEKVDLKESVKLIIRKVFNLCSTDLVLFKKGNIFIKLFAEDTKKVIDEKDKGTIAQRYNGIDEEDLESFHDEFFENEAHKNFFPAIAQEFIEIYFNQQGITNSVYEKNVFGYIQNITFEHLVSMYDNSDGFFTGFAGYIFRIHFNEVFEYIADIMLEKISIGSSSMIKFLEYYSAGVIVTDGHKYQVPTIKTEDGLRWSVVSMLSIAKIYSKTTKSIITLEKKITEGKTVISELYIDALSPIEYQANFIKSRGEIENEIEVIKRELDKHLDVLALEKDVEKKKILKKDIENIKNELSNLREEKQELSTKVIGAGIIKQYTELQKDIDLLKRQLQRAKQIIVQNKESYLSMRDSLVKALISKREKLT